MRRHPCNVDESAAAGREQWSSLVDLERLARWMDTQRLGEGPIASPTQLTGGTQNVLLKFRRGDREYVLRRPPLHPRSDGNETMRREARVLTALAGTDVPHPALIAFSSDVSILGAAFLLMEPVMGFNPTLGLPPLHANDAAIRREMGICLIQGLRSLSRVDFRATGLHTTFKPEGYLERQITRWLRQLKSYGDYPEWEGSGGLQGLDAVTAWLQMRVPRAFTPGIIHGDYHLANVMYRYDSAQIEAIVDWELSTVGDPLIDLGWLLATWPDEHGENPSGVNLVPWQGMPTQQELLHHYAIDNARDLTAMHWYKVFACFKFGIVLEGTYARATAGKASSAVGLRMHNAAIGLLRRALQLIN